MDLAEIVTSFMRILPQAIVSGVALGSVYALIAQGYYVTFTTTETVNFAQGEFLMVGALTSYTLMVLAGVNFLVALVAVVLLMAVMGMVVERVDPPDGEIWSTELNAGYSAVEPVRCGRRIWGA